MGFPLPDLIIESILRDGFENARNDSEVIEDVFSSLTRPYAEKKYGVAELNKIKKMVEKREVSIVHSFNLVNANIPCVSIQLAEESENTERASMSDFNRFTSEPFSTPEQLAGKVIVESFDPIAYDSKTGTVTVPDSVNLASVHVNLIFVDAAGTEHVILGGIVNDPGNKKFIIDKGSEVDLSDGAEIHTSIDFDLYNNKRNAEQTTVVLGIHTQEPLMTKYLYILIKYFLMSRKADLCSRGISLSTYSGSDFTRSTDYVGDNVFTRFLHVHGMLEPTWRADKVHLIDNVEVNVTVPRDKYGNEILGLTNSTVKVTEDKD